MVRKVKSATLVLPMVILSAGVTVSPARAVAQEQEVSTEQPSVPINEAGVRLVYVNQENPAYTLFQLIPDDTSPETIQNLEERIANLEKARLVAWEEFSANAEQYVQATLVRTDYPKYDMVEAITCLVREKPGWPWGLTWNGGIAFTRNDYEQVIGRYQAYIRDPKKYRPIRDRRRDPNHPDGFLPMAGCD